MPALPDGQLQQDLAAACHPDINTPFSSARNIFSRLAPYHLLHSLHSLEAEEKASSRSFESYSTEPLEEALQSFQKRLQVSQSTSRMHLSCGSSNFLTNLQISSLITMISQALSQPCRTLKRIVL